MSNVIDINQTDFKVEIVGSVSSLKVLREMIDLKIKLKENVSETLMAKTSTGLPYKIEFNMFDEDPAE